MFEQFWSLYPKKVARKEAEKAFNRLKSDERLRALEALPNHIEYWKATNTEKMFIPHCSTWLNGARFDDELDLPQIVPKEQAWWTSEQGILQQGKKEGIEPYGNESWEQLKNRIVAKMRAKA